MNAKARRFPKSFLRIHRDPPNPAEGFFFTTFLRTLPDPMPEQIAEAQTRLGGEFPLFDAVRRGSAAERLAARQKIIEKNAGLVYWHANQFMGAVRRHQNPTQADLVQAGYVGLLEGLERYDYTLGATFAKFIGFYVRAPILKEFARAPTVRGSRQPSISLDVTNDNGEDRTAPLIDRLSSSCSIVEELIRADDVRLTRELLAEADGLFTPRERKYLYGAYGLENGEPCELSVIGREDGCSRQRVHQIVGNAMYKLRVIAGSALAA